MVRVTEKKSRNDVVPQISRAKAPNTREHPARMTCSATCPARASQCFSQAVEMVMRLAVKLVAFFNHTPGIANRWALVAYRDRCRGITFRIAPAEPVLPRNRGFRAPHTGLQRTDQKAISSSQEARSILPAQVFGAAQGRSMASVEESIASRGSVVKLVDTLLDQGVKVKHKFSHPS